MFLPPSLTGGLGECSHPYKDATQDVKKKSIISDEHSTDTVNTNG
jgi:hypothetical protein